MGFFDPLKSTVQNTLTRVGNFLVPQKPTTPASLFTQTNPKPVVPVSTGILQPKLTVPTPKPVVAPKPTPAPAYLSKGTSAQVVGPQPTPAPVAKTSTTQIAPPKAVSQGLIPGAYNAAKSAVKFLAPEASEAASKAKSTFEQVKAGASIPYEIAVQAPARLVKGMAEEVRSGGAPKTFEPKPGIEQAIFGKRPIEPLHETLGGASKLGYELAGQAPGIGEKGTLEGEIPRYFGALLGAGAAGTFEALNFEPGLGSAKDKILKKSLTELTERYGAKTLAKLENKVIKETFLKEGKEGLEKLVQKNLDQGMTTHVPSLTGTPTATERATTIKNIEYKVKAGEKLTPVEQAIHDAGGEGPAYTGNAVVPKPEVPYVRPEPIDPQKALKEALEITQPPKKTGGFFSAIKEKGAVVKAKTDLAYDALVAEFEPLSRAETAIRSKLGLEKVELPMAKRFELQAGAGAKAEADLIPFKRDVMDKVRANQEDFNAYLFLKRAVDRLQTDAEKRAVGDWSVAKSQAALQALQQKLGPQKFAEFDQVGKRYQQIMDDALRLQVESGRLSPEAYEKIKSMNDFYAPYKVLQYIEGDALQPIKEGISGSGRNIATTEDLSKAIKGIKDEEFNIEDILRSSAAQIYKSRVLAEKNLKMIELSKLAALDKEGLFIKKGRPTRYYPIEYKPAEEILHQLNMQRSRNAPQTLDQSFVKVGRALAVADEVGIPIKQKYLTGALGNATLGGIDSGGRIHLTAFTSQTIAHELGHIFDGKTGEVLEKKAFGKTFEVSQRLSSFVNGTGFKGELRKLIDFTKPGAPKSWSGKGTEKFAEFVQLYIHDPKKARELAPQFTEFFELKLLPENKIRVLVDKLADFFQKVDGLPNIKSRLDEMDNNNYLDLAIRRAFPDKKPQLGVTFGSKAREGFKNVEFLKDGKVVALEVRADLARAIEGLNQKQVTMVSNFLGEVAKPFKFGATAGSIGFQVFNSLLYDPRRLAQMSRFGINHPSDFIRFPLDWVEGVATSIYGNVFNGETDLYTAFLKSGMGNSTPMRGFFPETWSLGMGKKPLSFFQPKESLEFIRTHPGKAARQFISSVLDTGVKMAAALEEGTKITGLKRGLRDAGIHPREVGTAGVQDVVDVIASEGRNYAGSPDFGRKGFKTPEANLLFMFFSPRVQGTDVDVSRMTGRTGKTDMKRAWARYMATSGVAQTTLSVVNRMPGNKEDYDQRPQWERDNYFLIPRDSYTTNDEGERVRDYWRIPKREMDQYISNVIDSFFDFAYDRDPKVFAHAGMSVVEGMLPINIQGRNLQERGESIVSSANPSLKVSYELLANRDTFRHRDIVPQNLTGVSPEEQYLPSTNPLYKKLGKATGTSPLKLQAASRGFFAGGLEQFVPAKAQGDRPSASTLPVLSRLYSSPTTDDSAFYEASKELKVESATVKLQQKREAQALWEELNAMPPEQATARAEALKQESSEVYKALQKIRNDEALGLTAKEQYMNEMPKTDGTLAKFVVQWIRDQKMSDADANAWIANLRKKKIVTDPVYKQLVELSTQ